MNISGANMSLTRLNDVGYAPREAEVPTPASVQRMTSVLRTIWDGTAQKCRQRAVELRAAAEDLDEKADRLIEASNTLPDEIVGAVQFEINARERATQLALVNPTE